MIWEFFFSLITGFLTIVVQFFPSMPIDFLGFESFYQMLAMPSRVVDVKFLIVNFVLLAAIGQALFVKNLVIFFLKILRIAA